MNTTKLTPLVFYLFLLTLPLEVFADEAVTADEEAALAKKLSNPVASLISVPFQFNYNQNYGADDDGYNWTLDIEPVVPFSISEKWNLISRTIIPLTYQNDVVPGESQSGLGDITESLFFSPKAPTKSGWIWGAGPIFLFPSGSDEFLTTKKWGAGPTFVFLKQTHGWSFGALLNHVWSFAGDDDRPDVNASYMQPFLAYTTPTAWTYSINTESSYNWESEQWSAPIHTSISKLTSIGKQKVSFQGTARYWADSPDSGPEGWGFRFTATFLFPE